MLLLFLAGFLQVCATTKSENASAPDSHVQVARQRENEFDDSEKIFRLLNKGFLNFTFQKVLIFQELVTPQCRNQPLVNRSKSSFRS